MLNITEKMYELLKEELKDVSLFSEYKNRFVKYTTITAGVFVEVTVDIRDLEVTECDIKPTDTLFNLVNEFGDDRIGIILESIDGVFNFNKESEE